MRPHCVSAISTAGLHRHGHHGVIGQTLTVALRPEKLELSRKPPGDTRYNCAGRSPRGPYFGASSPLRVQLDSDMRLSVSIPNTERHGDRMPSDREVYATCAPEFDVVLT